MSKGPRINFIAETGDEISIDPPDPKDEVIEVVIIAYIFPDNHEDYEDISDKIQLALDTLGECDPKASATITVKEKVLP